MIMLRLLYGAVPFFCMGLLSWLNFRIHILAIGAFVVTLLFLFFLVKWNPPESSCHSLKFDWESLKQFLRSYGRVKQIIAIIVVSGGWILLICIKKLNMNVISSSLMIAHVFSSPLLFWMHNATRRDHDKRREVFRQAIQNELGQPLKSTDSSETIE
jgi:hypothetical protein